MFDFSAFYAADASAPPVSPVQPAAPAIVAAPTAPAAPTSAPVGRVTRPAPSSSPHDLTAECSGFTDADTMVSYNGEVPWHHTTTGKRTWVIDGPCTDSATALADSGFVAVEKFGMLQADTLTPVESFVTVRRVDTKAQLSVTRETYEVFQGEELISIFDSLVENGLASYETLGTLHGGKRTWVQIRFASREIVKGDAVHIYALASNSHDGLALKLTLCSQRVVCGNTQRIAEAEGELLASIKHTRNMRDRVAEGVEALEAFCWQAGAQLDKYEALAKREMTMDETREYLCSLIPAPTVPMVTATRGQKAAMTRAENIRNEIFRLMQEGKGHSIEGVMGTAWGVFNAATEYSDHYANVGFESSQYGTGADFKDRAFETICQYLPAMAA